MRFYMGMATIGNKISNLNSYLREPKAKRIMISYYYYKYNLNTRFIADGLFKWNEDHPDERIDIMVDSGAFSLMVDEKKLSKIDIDGYVKEYGEFVTIHEKQINRFIELDIQSLTGTAEYERLYKLLDEHTPRHRKPTIVWHITEDISKFDKDLDRCIGQGDNLICIGGAAALKITGKRSVGSMMQQLCWYAAGKGINVHGLGITSKVARYIDFYSVDSLSFMYDTINNREVEGPGKGKLRDNYGTNGGGVYSCLMGKLMQYCWDVY